jgi:hypothetical protein
VRVAAHHLEDARAETQRVLERVQAFEHRQRAIAPGAAEAGDQRAILHAAMIASSAAAAARAWDMDRPREMEAAMLGLGKARAREPR